MLYTHKYPNVLGFCPLRHYGVLSEHRHRLVGMKYIHEECARKRNKKELLMFAAFVVLLFAAAAALAQRTFPLNKPVPDEVVACFEKQAAVDIADAGEMGRAIALAHMRVGNCAVMQGMFVYTKKVHQQRNGWRVYEGTIGKVPVFVPTNWKAEGEVDT